MRPSLTSSRLALSSPRAPNRNGTGVWWTLARTVVTVTRMKLSYPLSLLRQALKFYGVEESLPLFDAITRMGLSESEGIPKDLVGLGLKMHLRGLLNTLTIQSNRDWVWPFWVERQFNPHYKGFVPRSHTLSHMNLTQRNWTILGALRNSHRCVVDPRGLMTPWQ